MRLHHLPLFLILLALAVPGSAAALGLSAQEGMRIKDIASVAGVRSNQLVGYGLVVGLDGTGDRTTQTPFTVQSIKSMLEEMGVTLPPGLNLQVNNVAAVMVTADLPPFARPGQTIDVTVSSLGNARSLRGGSLLMTPLRGADREIYAVAQGNLVVGGLGVGTEDGSRVAINVPSSGRIPNGASVERSVETPFAHGDSLYLNLHSHDFTTAHRMADAINNVIGPGTAEPLDGSTVRVRAPADRGQRVSYMSVLENLRVTPGDAPAKVIVNSRTGTVVIGSHVRVNPAAVSHGSLTVTIQAAPTVVQPNMLAGGETVVLPTADIAVEQDDGRMFLFEPGVSLDEIVRAVNEVGAAPGDLVAILEALRSAGALRAELVVI